MIAAIRSYGAKAGAWSLSLWSWTIAWVRGRYRKLQHRYGPGYLHAMLIAGFVALFLPLPGSSVIAVLLIMAIAEIQFAVYWWYGGAAAHRGSTVKRMNHVKRTNFLKRKNPLGLESITQSGERP